MNGGFGSRFFLDNAGGMKTYLDLLRHVRDHGARKDDRTGTGTLSVFGYQMRFDLAERFPLLTLMVAQATGHKPGEFVHTFGDVHLYLNHLEQADEQLARAPKPLPTMRLNPAVKDLFAFRYEDFTLEGYDPHPAIRAPIAV